MVMWLVNSAEVTTKQNIASYFRRPGVFQSGSGTPLLTGESGILQDGVMPAPRDKRKRVSGFGDSSLKSKSGTDDIINQPGRVTLQGQKGKGFVKGEENTMGFNVKKTGEDPNTATMGGGETRQELEIIAERIRNVIASSPELQELIGIVDVKVEADGLNIEIMDTDKVSMFAVGSARIMPEAQAAFAKLSGIINKLPNTIDIVGHTDSRPYPARAGGYSNWELSADRANAARRMLEKEGVKAGRITSVLGRADRELKNQSDPLNASNRRITLKMRFATTEHIDLAKNPGALQKFEQYEDRYIETLPPSQREKVHSFTSKEMIEGRREANTKRGIKLPEQEPRTTNPDFIQRDKIFSDSPVIGPSDPFDGR